MYVDNFNDKAGKIISAEAIQEAKFMHRKTYLGF